jgi:hypothetical protein
LWVAGVIVSLNAKTPASHLARRGLDSFNLFLLYSGRPIGEPRFNNRYYDNDANYDAVKKEFADSHVRLPAGSQCAGRKLETTIGHKLLSGELKLAALNKRAKYRSSSSRAPLNSFYQQINRLYLQACCSRRFHGDHQA